jgi:alkylation response protein AidB-like acyl-CoA dehydrogenase
VGYGRTIGMVTSKDGNLTALLSAHQSIGVPQPLKLFGTPEQKKKYLPRLAEGRHLGVRAHRAGRGLRPGGAHHHRHPHRRRQAFILNGEKLWCTNGTMAELLVVMARTPRRSRTARRSRRSPPSSWRWTRRGGDHPPLPLHGAQGAQNAVITLHNVRVPRENMIWGEGRGSSWR